MVDSDDVLCTGTLSTMMRLKYPEVVDMALSSSTPLLGYAGLADPLVWRAQVTNNFQSLAPGCPDTVRAGFRALLDATPTAVSCCGSQWETRVWRSRGGRNASYSAIVMMQTVCSIRCGAITFNLLPLLFRTFPLPLPR